MSVTRVKIAPVEHWCSAMRDAIKEEPRLADIAGMEVEILTDTMHWGVDGYGETGRAWMLTPESCAKMDSVSGLGGGIENKAICEHLLELD
jgi:hypothetical protein